METVAAFALGALLCGSGLAHWTFPRYFRTLVPSWVPAAGLVVAVSGVLNLGIGVLVATRNGLGAVAAVPLLAAYLLTHVDALRTATPDQVRPIDRPAGVVGRIVVNLGYVVWASLLAMSSMRH